MAQQQFASTAFCVYQILTPGQTSVRKLALHFEFAEYSVAAAGVRCAYELLGERQQLRVVVELVLEDESAGEDW